MQAAFAEAARQLQSSLAQHWSEAAAQSGKVRVQLTGFSRYAEYAEVVRTLRAVPGVTTVEPRRFVRGQADLLVHTDVAATQLRNQLLRAAPTSPHLAIKTVGDTLYIAIASGEVPERG
jgi:hypothetical protein